MDASDVKIPAELLPSDGRFGSGPSMVPQIALENLLAEAQTYVGNSHRRGNIKSLIKRFQDGCRTLFELPQGWEVLLGNGGATLVWDALIFGGIKNKSQHLCFGEFSNRFAQAVKNAPHLAPPEIINSEMGTSPDPIANGEVDFYALTQNETSTGVCMEITRPDPTGLVGVDATSSAGGMPWDPTQTDIYYFSLQKSFASDGGIWVACCSPQALKRFEELHSSRWCPATLDLHLAHNNSLKHQTLNTPGIITLYLGVQYVEWVLDNGGINWAIKRSTASTDYIYDWAEKCEWASPFIKNKSKRSPIIATITLDDKVPSATIIEIFKSNGIVDVDPYRKLDVNLLRFGLFPSRDPEDVKKLCKSLEFAIKAII